MEIKDILRNRRIEMGYTMKDVADRVGVSEGTISRWETGEIANMRRDKIALLADVLQLSPLIIMGLEDSPTVPTDGQSGWYLDPETARLAQEAFDNPDLRMLMDSSRDLAPEDLKILIGMAERLKGDKD